MARGIGVAGKRLMKLASVQLLLVVFGGSCAQAHTHHRSHAVTDGPGLRSASALVIDETHSSVLYSRNATVPAPIASITKLLTALVIADAKLPLDERIQITQEDRHLHKESFSRLAVGTTLSRGDLIHLALMASENRAAHALARTYPGGIDAFVVAMNAKAKALGMTSAHFIDPTGLSEENVASPEDLAKLVMAASHDPTIREYSTDRRYSVAVGRRRVEFRNTNSLVGNPTWDIVVQKTGYISEAGKCLVMQAIIDDRTIVMVLLNSYGRYTRTADAVRIRRWMEAKLAEHTSRSKA
jgi:serine-type D-Ala-D-Ala endopeptidase (penicillin-binding protein 7)